MAIITHIVGKVLQEAKEVLVNPTPTLAITVVALLVYTVYLRIQRTLKLPPGPYGYPILGILPFIKKEFHLCLYDYSKKFGKIMSLKMGIEDIVVLSDYKIIKKAFQTRNFTARPKTPLQTILGGYGKFIFEIYIEHCTMRYNSDTVC